MHAPCNGNEQNTERAFWAASAIVQENTGSMTEAIDRTSISEIREHDKDGSLLQSKYYVNGILRRRVIYYKQVMVDESIYYDNNESIGYRNSYYKNGRRMQYSLFFKVHEIVPIDFWTIEGVQTMINATGRRYVYDGAWGFESVFEIDYVNGNHIATRQLPYPGNEHFDVRNCY